jgi:hypothetical protein
MTKRKGYPMCEKLAAVHDQRIVLQEFIEWLMQKYGDMDVLDIHEEKIIFEFLEIDAAQLERERRMILEEAQRHADGVVQAHDELGTED